jgi:hypothetical protein
MALKIKSEEEYQGLLAKIKSKDKPILGMETLAKKASRRTKNPDSKTDEPRTIQQEEGINELMLAKVAKKRQGVKETPILTSLRECSLEVETSKNHISIAFKGARLFTLNEIYAMLQYRSYVIFAYKKQWHALVANALRLAGKNKPQFNGPCKVTLFRQGKRKVDRDSLMVMFKYIIDALKHDHKNNYVGIFDDDNPDIVYEDEKIQLIGDPIIGIRVEQIAPASLRPEGSLTDLFDRVPAALVTTTSESEKTKAKAARAPSKNIKPIVPPQNGLANKMGSDPIINVPRARKINTVSSKREK